MKILENAYNAPSERIFNHYAFAISIRWDALPSFLQTFNFFESQFLSFSMNSEGPNWLRQLQWKQMIIENSLLKFVEFWNENMEAWTNYKVSFTEKKGESRIL